MSLQKNIGLWPATTIVIGSVIGSNIFMKPATMAGQLGSPPLLIAVWAVAGIVSIFGAMVYAELGTMFPESGGQYIYLQKMYGDFFAYLYGWAATLVINTAAIAAIAFVCADYLGYFFHFPRFSPAVEQSLLLHIPWVADIFPLQDIGTKSVAVFIIVVLTVLNYRSVRSGNAIQFVATLLKTLAIVFLVLGLLFSGKGEAAHFVQPSADFNLSGWRLIAAFMAATTGALASYDGWSNINMVAGEIRDPQKTLTKSLLFGLGTCILIYVLMNLAFLYVLPIDEMAKSTLVASTATEKVMGAGGAGLIALLIVVSTFGATSVNMLTSARVVFAMGQDGNFFSATGKVHTRFQTPGNAVLAMGILSSLFILSGSFDVLTDMFTFMAWVYYAFTVAGLFLLRRRLPGWPRPYRIKAYPWIPVLFLLFNLLYIGATLYTDIKNYQEGRTRMVNSVLGLLLTCAGIPFYWYFRRNRRTQS